MQAATDSDASRADISRPLGPNVQSSEPNLKASAISFFLSGSFIIIYIVRSFLEVRIDTIEIISQHLGFIEVRLGRVENSFSVEALIRRKSSANERAYRVLIGPPPPSTSRKR